MRSRTLKLYLPVHQGTVQLTAKCRQEQSKCLRMQD